ncbi:MAG: hypothetical protein GY838_13695 [bacterium]|nr:hypothetical protein [bacterium]
MAYDPTKRRRYRQIPAETKRRRRLEARLKAMGRKPVLPDAKGSRFLGMLSVLQRPQSAMFNFYRSVKRGDTGDAALGAAWAGMTGREKVYFSDLLRDSGQQDGVGLVVKGLLGDIVLDPINVVPIGLLSKFNYAAKVKLFSTKKGMEAAWLYDRAMRAHPIGGVRSSVRKMFSNKPDISMKRGRVIEKEVMHRIKEYEEQGVLKLRDTPDGMQLDRLSAKVGPTKAKGRVAHLADDEFERLEAQLDVVNQMRAAPREGRLPHWVLGDIIFNAATNAKYAQNLARSGLMGDVKEFFLEQGLKLSDGDMRLSTSVAEALGVGIDDKILGKVATVAGQSKRKGMLDGLLAQADDADGVLAAGKRLLQINERRLSTERLHGVKARILGGAFLKAKKKALDTMEKGVRDASKTVLKGNKVTHQKRVAKLTGMAKLIRAVMVEGTGFGNTHANSQAETIADLLDKAKLMKNEVEVADWAATVLDTYKRADELRTGISGLGQAGAALGKKAQLFKQRWRRAGIKEIRTKSAAGPTTISYDLAGGANSYRKFMTEIMPQKISEKQAKITAKGTKKIKELTELYDLVPGYMLSIMDAEAARGLALDIVSGAERKGRAFVQRRRRAFNPKHQSMLQRKHLDKNGVPLTKDEVNVVLDATEAELKKLGDTMWESKYSVWDVFKGKTDMIGHFYEMDPVKLQVIRAQRAAKAIGGETFKNDMVHIFGDYRGPNKVSLGDMGKVEHTRFVKPKGKKGAKIDPAASEDLGVIEKAQMSTASFHPEVARAIDSLTAAYFTPEASQVFLKYYDGLQKLWKATTLFPFPAYHTRNLVGNIWNMAVGEFFSHHTSPGDIPFWKAPFDPESFLDMYRAARAQVHVTTGNLAGLEEMKVFVKAPTGSEELSMLRVFELAQEHGVIGRDFFSTNYELAADMEIKMTNALFVDGKPSLAAMKDAFTRQGLADLRTLLMPDHVGKFGPIRAGRAVAEAIENQARLAFFIKRLRVGDDVKVASAQTKKFLIDYTDITPFEQQVMRRTFPFYTWTRKNLPIQLEGLVNNPRRFARIDKFAHAVREPGSPMQPVLEFLGGPGQGLRQDELPENVEIPKWIIDWAGLPLRRTASGEIEFFTTKNWLPAAELESLGPGRLGRAAMDLLSPLLKTPIETTVGRSFFFDASLQGTAEFLGVEMPARAANALQNIRLLAEVDRLNLMSGTAFSTRRLRPESEEEFLQKMLRLFMGVKVYPTDVRMAKLRKLQEANRINAISVRKELDARLRESYKDQRF